LRWCREKYGYEWLAVPIYQPAQILRKQLMPHFVFSYNLTKKVITSPKKLTLNF